MLAQYQLVMKNLLSPYHRWSRGRTPNHLDAVAVSWPSTIETEILIETPPW